LTFPDTFNEMFDAMWLTRKALHPPFGSMGSGDLDELTAETLNWRLKELGALARALGDQIAIMGFA